MRAKKAIFILISIFLIIIFYIYLINISTHGKRSGNGGKNVPIVLWWTNVFPDYERTIECGYGSCRFSIDRNLLKNENTKAIAFYGSDLNVSDLPIPRYRRHMWALYHEESPKNVPLFYSNNIFKHFNITSTFSRHSDMPLTVQYLDSYDLLRSRRYLVPIGQKSELRRKNKLAPIAYIQSICDTMSGRDDYVKELMQYIDVDAYGQCLNNRELPEFLHHNYLMTIDSDRFYKFLARYKFLISYENGVCNDYLTEKFWRPLVIGSIPIYFGAPTVRDWLPNPKSVILIEDFDSPKALAEFIKKLDEDDTEYNKYLDHKYSQQNPVSNNMLLKALHEKEYESSEDIFSSFECFICKKIYSNFRGVANPSHYNCKDGIKYPKMQSEFKEWSTWKGVMEQGKCEGDLLDRLLIKNRNFTRSTYDSEVRKMLEQGKC